MTAANCIVTGDLVNYGDVTPPTAAHTGWVRGADGSGVLPCAARAR